VVFWRIKDAAKYLFNIQRPEVTVRDVAESAMRDIVGQSNIQPLLTGRQKTEQAVQTLMQDVLNLYGAGITIDQVQLQKVDPPNRFLKVYEEYRRAPEVTRQRMYLETMERELGGTDKIILDSKGGHGVVPFLPLDQLQGHQEDGVVQLVALVGIA
jgi:regulator of protease activity HflC (stomatin/prohibitin superfamily)